jgi:hypothetical protein
VKLARWVIIIGCFLLGFYIRYEVAAAVDSGHPFDKTMIRALIRCRLYPEEMAVLTNAHGKKCTVPLPPGTTHFQDGTYLSTNDNFEKYLKFTLLEFGWTKIIKQGETFLIRDKAGYRKFKIINKKYAGVYRRLKFELE